MNPKSKSNLLRLVRTDEPDPGPIQAKDLGEYPDFGGKLTPQEVWEFIKSDAGDRFVAADRLTVAKYCRTYATWNNLEYEMEQNPSLRFHVNSREIVAGSAQQWLSMQYRRELSNLEGVFPLSPIARNRVGGPPRDESGLVDSA